MTGPIDLLKGESVKHHNSRCPAIGLTVVDQFVGKDLYLPHIEAHAVPLALLGRVAGYPFVITVGKG